MDTTNETDGATDEQEAAYDVVVVGGGAAGLSATLALARARRSVLVVDAGEPRNAPAGHVHNYLGREGTPPLELLAIGREEVARYGAEVVADRVTGVARVDGGFRVVRRDGAAVVARRLLVTTGLMDLLPEVDGLAERWGTDVLHCPYCHGWEVRDQRVAILGTSALAIHHGLLWRQWTDRLTVIRHEPFLLDDRQAEEFAARGIDVVEGPAAALEVGPDGLTGVRLADGHLVEADAVVAAPRFEARGELLQQLGLDVAPFAMGDLVLGAHVPAEPTGATSVPGVWVAGNVTDPGATVIAAAAAGLKTASMLNLDLIAEDTAAAVAAHRA